MPGLCKVDGVVARPWRQAAWVFSSVLPLSSWGDLGKLWGLTHSFNRWLSIEFCIVQSE